MARSAPLIAHAALPGAAAKTQPEKTTLAERAYDGLRQDIVSGALGPGQPLRMAQLAQRYDMGFSPLREALNRGDLDRATRLLGRPYRMAGRVRLGKKLGRTLGYPTANLALQRKVVPLWGIFAVRVSGAGLVDHPAVSSLGTRPTVNRTDPLLEVHLFDFDGSLYGQYLDVDFVARLRDEQKFDSLDTLVAQMHRDAAAARAILGV